MSTEVTPGQEPAKPITATPPPEGGTPPPPQTPADPPPAAGGTPPSAVEAELRRARAEAAKYRVQAREAAEAKRKAEESALAEKGQFKELAEARGKELDELRQKNAKYEAREAEEQQRREAETQVAFDALPEEVRADVPADADARTKELAVRMYQRASGKAPPPRPPATAPTAPAAPPPANAGQKPPEPTSADYQRLAYLGRETATDKPALEAKVAAWRRWTQQHPEDA